jgi:hypothetical protein
MKIVAIIARILLGLMFLVFGLNPFLKFLPMPPLEGVWGQFLAGPSHQWEENSKNSSRLARL